MIVELADYKGSPVLTLKNHEDDKYPFSFGVKKAKMILEAIEEIKDFVSTIDGIDPHTEVKNKEVDNTKCVAMSESTLPF